MSARRLLLPLFALACVIAPSCRRSVVEKRPTIPFVRAVLADRTGREMAVLKRSSEPSVSSDICFIGPSVAAERFSELLRHYDCRDNVDGSHKSDGLPDFAGETLACLVDESLSVPDSDSGAVQFLRERTVRDALCALDTTLHISPYDVEGLGVKNSSKLIVLGSPVITRYGGFDVDTLFRSGGCRVPVLSPVELAFSSALGGGVRKLMNVGVIYDSRIASDEVYQQIFTEACARHSHSGSVCFTMPSGDRDSLMTRLLREYVGAGHGGALDAVIVDDMYVDTDMLKNEVAQIVSIMNESSMTYGRLVSKDFEVVSSFDVTAEAIFNYFREKNLFTHNIARPQLQTYIPVQSPGAEDASVVLIPGSYVQN